MKRKLKFGKINAPKMHWSHKCTNIWWEGLGPVTAICSSFSLMFQPANQLTDQPHPTDRPTNQPTKHPTDKPTNHPSNQLTDQPASQPNIQPTNRPTKQPSNRLTNQLTKHPTDQTSKQQTDRPTNQPANQISNQPTVCIAVQVDDVPDVVGRSRRCIMVKSIDKQSSQEFTGHTCS